MAKPKDVTNNVYGRLTAIRYSHTHNSCRHWKFKCECGNTTIARLAHVVSGATKSCGCLSRERTSASRTIHGECDKTKEYIAWMHLKSRCLNKNDKRYNSYGGRGISVCQEWIESYPSFLLHIGRAPSPKHSVDRIDNNGNYEPGNVKWSTAKEQSNNRRNNKKYRYETSL